MKILFVCHRPYHVIRSSQLLELVEHKYKNVQASIITYNVYNYAGGPVGSKSQIFKSFDHLFNYKAQYHKHIEFDRTGEPRIWNILDYLQYHNKTIKKIKTILLDIGPIDNIFFFSDKEKPVEMTVSLAKELFNSVIFLVDEGLVTYDTRNFFLLNILKKIIVWTFNIRNISHSFNYGRSNLFDYSLSCIPEKSVIQSKKNFVLPVFNSTQNCNVLNKKVKLPNGKVVLYVSSGLGWSYLYKNSDAEIDFLNQLISSLVQYGYKLTIKIHPNEPIDRYNDVKGAIIYDDPFVPAELLFSGKTIVLSQYSSTLLNAKLSGIPSACLVKLLELKETGSDISTSLVSLYCPSTWDELIKFIKDTMSTNEQTRIQQDDEFLTVLKH